MSDVTVVAAFVAGMAAGVAVAILGLLLGWQAGGLLRRWRRPYKGRVVDESAIDRIESPELRSAMQRGRR